MSARAGPDLETFEQEICRYTGAPHAVALSSGTAAIHLALAAPGIRRGGGDLRFPPRDPVRLTLAQSPSLPPRNSALAFRAKPWSAAARSTRSRR